MATERKKPTTTRKSSAGNRPLEKPARIANPETLVCDYCNKRFDATEFYNSESDFYRAVGKIPYCKECVSELFDVYYDRYTKLGYDFPDRRAIERLCMAFDMYYSDKIFDGAARYMDKHVSVNIVQAYFRQANLYQYKTKNYDTTVRENYNISQKYDDKKGKVVTDVVDLKSDQYENVKAAEDIFGEGYQRQDYLFLYKQYSDWTARHECNTKAQEEVFKEICLTQLELSKAHKLGQDTKDLNVTFQKLLDAGKLQPKQNAGETLADAQTFGTLIAKWETTRPLPEIDEELKDVDKIGTYIDAFFKGHLAKMLNLKNAFSETYDRVIRKYSATKPEYKADENNEMLYDAIFGDSSDDDDEGVV